MWLIHFSEIEDRENEGGKKNPNYQRVGEILPEFKTMSLQFLISLLAVLGELHSQQTQSSTPSASANSTETRNYPTSSKAPSIPCLHPRRGHLSPLLGVLNQLHRNYL